MDALVAPLRSDVLSGASAIAARAAGAASRMAAGVEAGTTEELREALAELSRAILDAQPAMAPLVTLGREILRAAAADEVETARRAIRRTAEGFEDDLEEAGRRVAERAAGILGEFDTILTISASSTVRSALLRLSGGEAPGIICLEGRPMLEGRRLAGRLARAGLPVTLAVDAAGAVLVRRADAVVVGADSVGDRGVANKIGTGSLALSARDAGVPFYVLADGTKLLPPGFPQPTDDDRPGEEVWESPGPVRIWNRYFETVPLDLFTGVVSEEGLLDGDALAARRRGLEVPPELREWARERTGEDGRHDD